MTEIFIDVRTDEEWSEGHLDGAVHFELARLEKGQLPDLPKETSIAVYCRAGVRAERARQILHEKGFANVCNAGGFEALRTQAKKQE